MSSEKKPKKLIYILNSYSKRDTSHFFHVINLLNALANLGANIILIIEKGDDLPKVAESIRVLRLGGRNGLHASFRLVYVLFPCLKGDSANIFIRITARTAILATLVARIAGGKTYLWQSSPTIDFDLAQPMHKRARWFFSSYIPNALARRVVDRLVTGPETVANYYVQELGVKRSKIVILPNDVDTYRFRPAKDRQKKKNLWLRSHGLQETTKIALIAHRMSPVRRTIAYFPNCVRPFSEFASDISVVFLVVGGGPELEKIKQATENLALNHKVIFLGEVPNADIHALYAISDIFVHPSQTEGFPRVIIEAMASGLPLVSTDAGGIPDIVGPLQRKYLADRFSPTCFHRTLHQVMCDSDLQVSLAQENLAISAQYSTEKVAAKYFDVFYP